MNSTDLIYAEAAIRSRRTDYLSIFDLQAQITPETLKRCLADPKMLQEAVQMLKQAGFTVTSVGKYSVSLLATRRLLEKTFRVKIVAEEIGTDRTGNPVLANTVQGGHRFGYIDTSTSAYKDLLAGIALSQPSVYTGAAEDCPQRENLKDPWPLCPQDVLKQLNIGQAHEKGASGKGIHVVVIDSGFFKHKYFEKHFKDAEVKLDLTVEQRILNRIYFGIRSFSSSGSR